MSGALRRRVERLEDAVEDAVRATARRIAARGTAGLFAQLGEPGPAELLDRLCGDTLRRYRAAGGTFSFLVIQEDWVCHMHND